MSGEIEKAFEVAVPVARAWQAFTQSEQLRLWQAPEYEIDARPGGRVRYGMPGFPAVEGRVEEVVPEKLLRYTEGPGILPGFTEITVSFEDAGGRARVTLTHAGFGDGEDWLGHFEGHSLGWEQAIADLVLYLERGVAPGRFFIPMSDIGMLTAPTAGGREVVKVAAGGYADQAGFRSGDVIARIGDVAVYTLSDLFCVMRGCASGDRVEAVYVRDGQKLSGVGALPARDTREDA